MNKTQKELVRAEIETMLRNGAISQIDHTRGEFISSVFFVEEKDGVQRPVINLKNLNSLCLTSTSVEKFEFTPVPLQERRLHDQAGFEGCSLLRTSPHGISKICSISMGR